jgi:hypothetical protein
MFDFSLSEICFHYFKIRYYIFLGVCDIDGFTNASIQYMTHF